MPPQYAIGIDLGTSNCALAHTPLRENGASKCLNVTQADGPDTFAEARTLPSFLYRPPDQADWVPGRWARDMSFLQPERVAHSAKSWLCHGAVDRQGRLLPWQSEDIPPAERLSPVEVSARLLRHLRQDWERLQGLPLPDQRVAITLPASFDAAAQQLTLEAALAAGFPETTLLMEEPQAAFYRWLESHPDPADLFTENRPLQLLVLDIGGGTTDFSLFELAPGDPPDIRRTAVGDHLLLGGDNLDRYLASAFRTRLEARGHRLGARQWSALLAESRRIKEALLTPGETDPASLTLAASGSGLFADSPTLSLDPDALREELIDAFFPSCEASATPARRRAGLRELGLPYAADPAVTRHLADFLRERPPVDLVLCNGGTLFSPLLQERLRDLLGTWQAGAPPRLLAHRETDVAVARGASVYAARLERGKGLIEAGAARSIYLELLDPSSRQSHLLCVLPQGAPADRRHRVDAHPMRVTVDTPVRFQTYSSTRRPEDAPGDLLPADAEDLHPLPPLQTQMELPSKGPKPANQQVHVAVEAHLSASGLLKLSLASVDKAWRRPHTWELVFNLRATEADPAPSEAPAPDPGTEKARAHLIAVLGKKGHTDPRAARRLFKTLETTLGLKRKEWDPGLCRDLWPGLREGLTRRNRSRDHEAAWLNLAGFLLRPGFGVELDAVRLNELWRLHELGLAFPKEARGRTQLWILWRRVAGGLDTERQRLVADQWLAAAPGKKAPVELIRLSGALERVDTSRKQTWIRAHLKQLPSAPEAEARARAWALGGLLARLPFTGGPEDVLPPECVEEAFDRIQARPGFPVHLPEGRQALIAAARLTGEPRVDLSEPLRERILHYLAGHDTPESDLEPLHTLVPERETDRLLRYGDSLPPGLLLVR